MNIKLRLKELREEPINFIRQKELAKLLNIHSSVYSKYEGEIIIPLKKLNTLCNYYNVSIDFMFYNTNIRNYKDNKDSINIELVSRRLKNFRLDNNLTQKELAKAIDVEQSQISRYEKNTKIISTYSLYTICKKYNISADYLLGKTDEPKYLN